MEKVLVSACLLGINCRYDGLNCKSPESEKLLSEFDAVPFCPEILGGMSTPRKKSGIIETSTKKPATGEDVWDKKARVLSEDGNDVTENFIRGAEESMKMALMLGIRKAFLKSRSPSCGISSVSCFGEIIPGNGVCAAYLRRKGIEIFEKN
ncbi:MAG: DUF523 domain-containing protein [Candidatus Aureabacteria bacterium]|nr:DUF523 domain-containing protein [Candidatus Auribacterota bacterium]